MTPAEVSDASQFPIAIVNHETSAVLELRWQDGSVSRLPHPLLRAHCRCAACQQLQRREGRHPEADASIRLEGIDPVSDQGLNLVFSDGHGRGIFPWPYLHDLGLLATN